jgi:GDP-L-fucose synthase
MTILVAGGSGLVGSAVVRTLRQANRNVIGISSNDVNLLDREKTFSFIQDLKPIAIIDAAAKVGGIGGNNAYPVEFLSQNLQIQTNLMDAAHNANVDKFVFLGSSCIYPKESPQPIKEEYLLTGELEQTNSAYAIAKISGIELIRSYRKEFGHKWISLMPTNLYGPNDNFDLENGHVLPAMIRKFVEAQRFESKEVTAWGTGTPLREFLYVEDLARAVILCLDRYDDAQHINVGTAEEISIKHLAEKIASKVGFKGKILWDNNKPDGTFRKVLDNQKILNLGWKPIISLDEGLTKTIEWYKQTKKF